MGGVLDTGPDTILAPWLYTCRNQEVKQLVQVSIANKQLSQDLSLEISRFCTCKHCTILLPFCSLIIQSRPLLSRTFSVPGGGLGMLESSVISAMVQLPSREDDSGPLLHWDSRVQGLLQRQPATPSCNMQLYIQLVSHLFRWQPQTTLVLSSQTSLLWAVL